MNPAVPQNFKRILVPTDFSACAGAALSYALDLARSLRAEIKLCHAGVLPDYQIPGQVSPAMHRAAAELVQQCRLMFETTQKEMAELIASQAGSGVSLSSALVEGYADEGILHCAAEWPSDLIVIGSHGRRGLSHWFLGSVTERVMRRASCPVLVVHPPQTG